MTSRRAFHHQWEPSTAAILSYSAGSIEIPTEFSQSPVRLQALSLFELACDTSKRVLIARVALGSRKFDGIAPSYDALYEQSLAASGESKEYFARYKLACLSRLGVGPDEPILDWGCGIGNVLGPLAAEYREVHGYDPSEESIKLARERVANAVLHGRPEDVPSDHFGAAILSGVLHHVPEGEHRGLIETVRSKLRPGGRVVVFEHNPLNPVTRRAVAACEFDAIMK